MSWIDGHLDLAYLAVNGRNLRIPVPDPSVGCLSLPALREANVTMAFGTIFTEVAGTGPPGTHSPHDAPHIYRNFDDRDGAHRAGMMQLELYEQLESEGEIRIVRTKADIEHDDASEPLRILILMEGADPVRSPSELGEWFERGVRMIGLTWAMGSRYAAGNAAPGPLTPEGIDMVRAMDELGVIHDISHLADESFEQLAAIVRGPVVASHSNARALATNSERHLRDDQIEWISRRGGVIGLNLYRKFLSPERTGTLGDVVNHAQHVVHVMGHSWGVALGSDIDGGFPPTDLATGLEHPRKLPALSRALRDVGWSEEQVQGLQRDNWLRFLRRALP